MDKYNLLDCTLRDGGYINKWRFPKQDVKDIIKRLIEANMDFVEVGYLNVKNEDAEAFAQFPSIEAVSEYIPDDKRNCTVLAMADVDQFPPEAVTAFKNGGGVDGIRVVFYKHQVDQAIALAKRIVENGYKLFMQPMVTIDYSLDEYAELARKMASTLHPYAVSIVDSFGYMLKSDFRCYYKILDNILDKDALIGFHSHNNMNLAFVTAEDILEYNTSRRLIIDSTLYGMGRGAGNLNTELIANYYNRNLGDKYDLNEIVALISDYIMPVYEKREWGYNPYYFITGREHYHPNYAAYLLEEKKVSVEEFAYFLKTIPEDMKTKCRKPYVLEKYAEYERGRAGKENRSNINGEASVRDDDICQAKKVAAVIPIKLNNERLPGKNTKLLCGIPLIRYILTTLRECRGIDDIYVYCSDDAVVEYLPEGVTFLKRPKSLDEPTANFTQIFESFSSEVRADVYVYTHATAPLIKSQTIDSCIEKVIGGEFDSAFTAAKIQDFLWRDGRPLNFDAANIPRSQDLESIYRETSGVYVFTSEVFDKYKRRVGINPFVCEVGSREATDINTQEDFDMAEFWLSGIRK